MNRYDVMNAASKINGYYFPPSPHVVSETVQSRFDDARKECAEHLKRQLEDVEKLTLEQFLSARR